MNQNLTAAIELLEEEMLQLDPDRLDQKYGEPQRQFDRLVRNARWNKVRAAISLVKEDAAKYVAIVDRTCVEPKRFPPLPYEFRKERGDLVAQIGGTRITGWTATDVFCNVLSTFGLERVAQLGLRLCGLPLVSAEPPPQTDRYPSIRKVQGWHIVVHCNTAEKTKILRRIGQLLANKKLSMPLGAA
ncbi:MAG: hypothetical protein U1A72_19195 [Sulfuritalea sp.]|nr:hypothetical protein [Sulfuritalea sp.]